MRLLRLELKNFRRIAAAAIHFSPSTFIVGPNNTSKSSIIAAIEALLSLEKEKLAQEDILERPDGTRADDTTITAHFGDISPDVAASRGFRGRVIDGQFVYRKSLTTETYRSKGF
jgi:putative ATP-dependent endonuclease of OLD family